MTVAAQTIDRGAALGREGVELAQDVVADVAGRLGDATSDAPTVMKDVGIAAREIAADLPEGLRDVLPGVQASSTDPRITAVRGLVAIGFAIVLMAVVVASVRRSRRAAERRRQDDRIANADR